MTAPRSLIVKTSSACNLACTYCDADIYSKEKMSFSVLAHLTAKALRGGGPTHFIWHGGEPLLLGQEFYRKAVWLQERYRQPDQLVSNALQTNATLLDDEWLDLFAACRFSLGVSLDGPAHLHDGQRVLRSGRHTHDKVMHGISLLKSRDHPFGVLAVVTEATLALGARRFFDFFVDNGLKSFAVLCQRPAIIKGAEEHMLRDAHSRFVCDLFDLWYERDDPDIHIRDFESIMRALLGGEHGTCLLAGQCIGKYFAVNFNGDIFHCDEFMTDSRYRLGNIIVDDFSSILTTPTIELLRNSERGNHEQLDCPWTSICNGGCPKDRTVAAMFSGGSPVVCCGYAPLIEHIHTRIAEDPRLAQLAVAAAPDENYVDVSGR